MLFPTNTKQEQMKFVLFWGFDASLATKQHLKQKKGLMHHKIVGIFLLSFVLGRLDFHKKARCQKVLSFRRRLSLLLKNNGEYIASKLRTFVSSVPPT